MNRLFRLVDFYVVAPDREEAKTNLINFLVMRGYVEGGEPPVETLARKVKGENFDDVDDQYAEKLDVWDFLHAVLPNEIVSFSVPLWKWEEADRPKFYEKGIHVGTHGPSNTVVLGPWSAEFPVGDHGHVVFELRAVDWASALPTGYVYDTAASDDL